MSAERTKTTEVMSGARAASWFCFGVVAGMLLTAALGIYSGQLS